MLEGVKFLVLPIICRGRQQHRHWRIWGADVVKVESCRGCLWRGWSGCNTYKMGQRFFYHHGEEPQSRGVAGFKV